MKKHLIVFGVFACMAISIIYKPNNVPMKKIRQPLINPIILFSILCFLGCANAHAEKRIGNQEDMKAFRWGITGGMNVSSPTSVETKVGYQLGLRGEWDFKSRQEGTFLSFGLLLNEKGWKHKYYVFDTPSQTYPRMWKKKATPACIEVPVHIGYRWKVKENLTLFASAGLYANFGVFGKEKATASATATLPRVTYSIDYYGFNNASNYANCDWGIGYRIGMEAKKHYQIAVSNEWGMRNLYDGAYHPKMKNRNFSLSFTYMF